MISDLLCLPPSPWGVGIAKFAIFIVLRFCVSAKSSLQMGCSKFEILNKLVNRKKEPRFGFGTVFMLYIHYSGLSKTNRTLECAGLARGFAI